MNRFVRCFVVLSALAAINGCAPKESPLKDGEYFGYEFLPNLSPTEDPDGFWYYSGVLRISKDAVALKQSPTHMTHGKVVASASDGGFPEYDGKVIVVGERTLVSLRKVSCDYCGIPVNDPLPSKIEREYVVRFIPDGTFELNGVIYSSKPDQRLVWKPE